MKKILILTTMFVALALVSFGQDLTGSAHDFRDGVTAITTTDAWNAIGTMTSNRMCGPCHTPHNAQATQIIALWSHAPTVEGAYTLYDNTAGTQNSTPGQPAGVSRACLSCHDGTIHLDNHVGNTTAGTFMTGNAMIGTTLSNDHPVSITYDGALESADGGLADPTTDPVLSLLFGGEMECASCHNPHGESGVTKLLRMDNTNSELCLTCHVK